MPYTKRGHGDYYTLVGSQRIEKKRVRTTRIERKGGGSGEGGCCVLLIVCLVRYLYDGDKNNGDCEKMRKDVEVYLDSLVWSPIGSLC